MPTLDSETRQLINDARILGGGRTVYLEDYELIRLCAVIAADLGQSSIVGAVPNLGVLSGGYYATPLEWFTLPVPEGFSFDSVFAALQDAIEDFATYFKNLCALHKRRLKYRLILECQPIPKLEPIIPRCLLEFGLNPSEALASWLVWRKWLYDIDNRSAQETGYLFEPILASALGGRQYAARQSPIRRASNPTKGRQVDCITDRTAYEFKMRVTIAASGQGRFQEELDFASDCSASGYTPVLLVLDPSTSARLVDLTRAYTNYGGRAYIGDDAWSHIREKAGTVMGRFVEQYVRKPIEEVQREHATLQPISLVASSSTVSIQIGDEEIEIRRRQAGECKGIQEDKTTIGKPSEE